MYSQRVFVKYVPVAFRFFFIPKNAAGKKDKKEKGSEEQHAPDFIIG